MYSQTANLMDLWSILAVSLLEQKNEMSPWGLEVAMVEMRLWDLMRDHVLPASTWCPKVLDASRLQHLKWRRRQSYVCFQIFQTIFLGGWFSTRFISPLTCEWLIFVMYVACPFGDLWAICNMQNTFPLKETTSFLGPKKGIGTKWCLWRTVHPFRLLCFAGIGFESLCTTAPCDRKRSSKQTWGTSTQTQLSWKTFGTSYQSHAMKWLSNLGVQRTLEQISFRPGMSRTIPFYIFQHSTGVWSWVSFAPVRSRQFFNGTRRFSVGPSLPTLSSDDVGGFPGSKDSPIAFLKFTFPGRNMGQKWCLSSSVKIWWSPVKNEDCFE